MSEKVSYSPEMEMAQSEPKLNQEFRTLLGSKTDYGTPYTKGILKEALSAFFNKSLASGASLKFHGVKNTSEVKIFLFTSEAESYATHITRKIDNSHFFKQKGDKTPIDEFEEKQLDMIVRAVQSRIEELNIVLEEDLTEEERLDHQKEKELIIKLLQ